MVQEASDDRECSQYSDCESFVLAIESLVNTAKNIENTHLMCLYMHWHSSGHSLYGKAQGARAAGQYSYCPNHILGNMNIALVLVSFMAYSGSARHLYFDPPMQ